MDDFTFTMGEQLKNWQRSAESREGVKTTIHELNFTSRY